MCTRTLSTCDGILPLVDMVLHRMSWPAHTTNIVVRVHTVVKLQLDGTVRNEGTGGKTLLYLSLQLKSGELFFVYFVVIN